MKEAFSGVRADAAMMRSPSFSREGESRTITKESFAGDGELVCVMLESERRRLYQRLLLRLVLSQMLDVQVWYSRGRSY
jgi:hypothetical protein